MDVSKKSQRSAKVYATEIDLYKLGTFSRRTLLWNLKILKNQFYNPIGVC